MHPPVLAATPAPSNLPRPVSNIMRGALLATSVITSAILLLVIWHIQTTTLNWFEVRDFVAPTAAQIRDGGWVNLSEGIAQ